MKTYKDIYKFPLKKFNHGGWVYDQKSNFVFQFEPKFINGNYVEGWLEFEQKIINCLNDVEPIELSTASIFNFKDGNIYIEQAGESSHIITIRGWGNLTGIGGHNLSSDEAANIQDTFAEFIINKLNNKDMKEFKPIAMRCNQQQCDEIKQILLDNGCNCNLINNFEDRCYLINNLDLIQKKVANIHESRKNNNDRTVFETWNKDTFLKYCGIETKNNWVPKVGDWVILIHPSNTINWSVKMIEHVGKCVQLNSIGDKNTHFKIQEDKGEWVWEYSDRTKHFRKAETHEISNNQNNKTSKQADINELLEEAKKRYPVGTQFYSAYNTNHTGKVISNNYYIYNNTDIVVNSPSGYSVYSNGKWAEILETVETKSKYQIAAEEALKRFKDIKIGDEYITMFGEKETASKLPEIIGNDEDCYIDCGRGYLWQYDRPDKFGYKINKQNSEYSLTPKDAINFNPNPLLSLQGIGYESSSLFDALDYKSSIKEIQPNQLIIKKKIVMDTKINPTQSINTNLKIKK